MVHSAVDRSSMTEPHINIYPGHPDRRHPISGCGVMPTGDDPALSPDALRAQRKAA
jgi:hypothetical protein